MIMKKDRVRVYLVGVTGRSYIFNEFETPYVLESYYSWKKKGDRLKDWCVSHDTKLLLDSGAYSAWSQKIVIPVQEYIDFVHRMEGVAEHYVNLDDIEDYNKTWENQKEMERQGLNPVPVYHYGEPISVLNKIMDNYEYFGIGGVALRKSPQIRTGFFDMIFKRLCTKATGYRPSHKVHGFGMTSLDIVLRYPWYSVDSTTWINAGKYGEVMIPRRRRGEWVYDDNAYRILVSAQSLRRGHKGLAHKPPEVRKTIHDYIGENGFIMGESEFKEVKKGYRLKSNERWADDTQSREIGKVGLKVETVIDVGIGNTNRERDKINYLFFLNYTESIPDYGWEFKTKAQTLGKGW